MRRGRVKRSRPVRRRGVAAREASLGKEEAAGEAAEPALDEGGGLEGDELSAAAAAAAAATTVPPSWRRAPCGYRQALLA